MKKLIMSDLDNTLLPLDQEAFVEVWYRDVSKKFFEYGLDPERGVKAVEAGCKAMIFNDGKMKNRDAFYAMAEEESGYAKAVLEPIFDDYYGNEFSNIRSITVENPFAPAVARLMREKAETAVIATMPMFPLSACDMRVRWTGINAGMFDLVTTYDFSSYCKPNPLYYQEILDFFGVRPEDALMIGNDVREDVVPCDTLGVDTFLVTNHIITHGLPFDRFRHGTYLDLLRFLETL